MTIESFFPRGSVDVAGLSSHLDALDDEARAAAVRGMTPGQQAKLFDAARGYRAVNVDHFVPASVGPLVPVVHTGKNSIPIVSHFEKRFCRLLAGAAQLCGYNENPPSVTLVSGPGYFVAYDIADGEVLIDYTHVPAGKPAAWPAIKPNSAGLSRFIYYGTKDTMRGVSKHVSIGRAARNGKVMDNWFVLCRRDR